MTNRSRKSKNRLSVR